MMEQKEQKNSKKKKALAVVLAALLLIGAGVTAAYFTDHHAVMNEFTFGEVKSELTEPKWETDESGKTAAQQIRPNMTIVKDPQIKNIGKSDSYNFIMFTVPFDRFAAFGDFIVGLVPLGMPTHHPEIYYPNSPSNPNPPPTTPSIERAKDAPKDAPIVDEGIFVKGRCIDFDPYCTGPIDTYEKDLFQHEADTSNWILVDCYSSLGGSESNQYRYGYQTYVYAYATGADAVNGKMTTLKPGETTKPLFVGEKLRVINLGEDAWAIKSGCAPTENVKFDIPVTALSIQTTDIITTDGPNDEGATDPWNIW